ncbi:hypothetical protein DL93DRAFT_561191 [Clavulina sp. PMI_390]|nr:hypothetical protein DL93DRAFT_561191 [Clavulina sp. PMI_390]
MALIGVGTGTAINTQTTGERWIQRVNMDVVEHTLNFLDPWSLLQFTSACKSFHELFFDDRVLWSRVFRIFAAQNCLAPHSFDHPKFDSTSALRLAAIRFYRIADAVANPSRSLNIHTQEYRLDLRNSRITRDPYSSIYQLGDILLPGGRWLLSAISESKMGTTDTHLSCTDLLSAVNGKLEPAASITFEGIILQQSFTGIAKVQMCEDRKSVVIACSFLSVFRSEGNDTLAKVLLLTWDSDGCPQFSEAACINRSDLPFLSMNGGPFYIMSLVGDLLAFETMNDLAIWNWRSDQMIMIDPQQHHWASGPGYALQVMGPRPLVYMIPTDERELLVSELPPLVPRDSSSAKEKRPFISTHTIPMHSEISGSTEVFSIVMLEGWKPASMSSAAIVFCRGHQHLMTLELDNAQRLTQNCLSSIPEGVIDDSLRTRHNVEYLSLGNHHRFGRCIYSAKVEPPSGLDNDEQVSQPSVQLAGYSLADRQIQSCASRKLPVSSEQIGGMGAKELCIYSGTAVMHDDDAFSPVPTPYIRVMYIE